MRRAPRRLLLLAALLGLWIAPSLREHAWAIQPGEMLADPTLEARARAVGKELRCPVCQNQSIDDSDADLAHDLRVLVRQRIMLGDTDAEVKHYIVDRYGDYILLKPPLKMETILLWIGPLALFLCAIGLAVAFYRRRGVSIAAAPLSAEESRRIAELAPESGPESEAPE
jgi:cytochrome c-type biogenesis protein CcmH